MRSRKLRCLSEKRYKDTVRGVQCELAIGLRMFCCNNNNSCTSCCLRSVLAAVVKNKRWVRW